MTGEELYEIIGSELHQRGIPPSDNQICLALKDIRDISTKDAIVRQMDAVYPCHTNVAPLSRA